MKNGDTFRDPRDGVEYKTFLTSDGTRWFADNLNHAHDASEKPHAIEGSVLGREYPYSSLEDAIPEGWTLPTVKEWRKAFKEYDSDIFNLPEGKTSPFGREYSFWTASATRSWFQNKTEGSMCTAKIIENREFYIFNEVTDTPMLVRCVQR